MKKLSTLIIATAIAAIAACSGEKPAATTPTAATPPAPAAAPAPAPAPAPVAAAADPVAEADTIFSTRCASCHGAAGAGDGVAAAALNPKPRAFGDKAWQASVDDTYLAKVIVEGGVAVGKSPLMTANADLKDKPEVVKALVAKVRSYGQ
jgi:mono/diheme cytochrome c family protein